MHGKRILVEGASLLVAKGIPFARSFSVDYKMLVLKSKLNLCTTVLAEVYGYCRAGLLVFFELKL